MARSTEKGRSGESPPKHPQKRRQVKPATRLWKVRTVTPDGCSEIVELTKHDFMRRTGLPARDLRPQGPLLSPAATILGREGCIIVSLEHVKAVIQAEETFVLDPMHKEVLRFLAILQRRLSSQALASQTLALANAQGSCLADDTCAIVRPISVDAELECLAERKQEVLARPQRLWKKGRAKSTARRNLEAEEASAAEDFRTGPHRRNENKEEVQPGVQAAGTALVSAGSDEALPFEFQVLEAILEASIGQLQQEWRELKAKADPALDQLTKVVTTSCLALVRTYKSRMTQLTSRVQKVRDELEQLLDDDQDMADLYLTRRLLLLRMLDLPDSTSQSPSLRGNSAMQGQVQGEIRVLSVGPTSVKGLAFSAALGARTSSLLSSIQGGKDIQELEMLLEAYFVQAEGILNELRGLHEFVDDTEDYVNIYLDNHRNVMQGANLLITGFGTVLSVILIFLGLYSMNVQNALYNVEGIFTEIMVSILVVSIAMYAGFIFYVRRAQIVTI